MPQRTNEFQQLVHAIQAAIADDQTTVTESYVDPDGREVDILVERKVNNIPIKIAIECRDHKRKQDVTWIDSLIGKYISADVQKIIAVSSSPFTKAAEINARNNSITLLTLEEAKKENWAGILSKIGFLFYEFHHDCLNIQVHIEEDMVAETLDEAITKTLDDAIIRLVKRDIYAPLDDYLEQNYRDKVLPKVREEISKVYLKPSEQPEEEICLVELSDLDLELATPVDEQALKVHAITFIVKTRFVVTTPDTNNYIFDSKPVVSVKFVASDGRERATMVVTEGNTDNQIKGYYTVKGDTD